MRKTIAEFYPRAITTTTGQDGRRKLAKRGFQLPLTVEAAGERAQRKFVEFFIAQISNQNTRKAYGRADLQFYSWCEERSIGLEDISPNVAAVYIRPRDGADATVKQPWLPSGDFTIGS